MRPQDERSQQSCLGLCNQDSGIWQSRRKIPHSNCSLQKMVIIVLLPTLIEPQLLNWLIQWKYDHITPLLRDVLHWLPVPLRIEYKVCLLVYKSLYGASPGYQYLRDYCIETYSSASGLLLRSTDKHDRVGQMKTRFGDRAFLAAGPSYWNSLPSILRAADSVDSFKTGLKTYLLSRAYSAVCWL